MSTTPVFVFDTCIWIDLTEKSVFAPALDELFGAVNERELRIGIPEGVEREWGSPEKVKEARKRRAQTILSQAADLRRVSAELSAEFRARLTSTLNGLEDELQKYGDSLQTRIDQVHEIWSSPSTLRARARVS